MGLLLRPAETMVAEETMDTSPRMSASTSPVSQRVERLRRLRAVVRPPRVVEMVRGTSS